MVWCGNMPRAPVEKTGEKHRHAASDIHLHPLHLTTAKVMHLHMTLYLKVHKRTCYEKDKNSVFENMVP